MEARGSVFWTRLAAPGDHASMDEAKSPRPLAERTWRMGSYERPPPPPEPEPAARPSPPRDGRLPHALRRC